MHIWMKSFFILPRFYNAMITNLMFRRYNETVIKKIIKNTKETLIMKTKKLVAFALAAVCVMAMFAGC